MPAVDLQRYRGADCSLYRVPTLDLTGVTRAIEDAVTAAWEAGDSASVDGWVDDNAVAKVAAQLNSALSLQRERRLEQIKAESDREVAAAAAERDRQLAEISQRLINEEARKQAALDALAAEKSVAEEQQDSVAAVVERLSEEASRKRSRVGNETGRAQLVQVQRQLTTHGSFDALGRREPLADVNIGEVEAAIGGETETIAEDPLVMAEPDTAAPSWYTIAGAKRIMRRAWRFVNRPLW